MSDPRLIPANGRVAAEYLRGQVESERFAIGEAYQVKVPVADLLNAAQGRRERQLLYGQSVTMYESKNGWSFVQAKRDGYVGYLHSDDLMPEEPSTHRVCARATHIYSEPDFKSPERMSLSHLSRVRVLAQSGKFSQVAEGYISSYHIEKIDKKIKDPVSIAELYLGTPYL